MAFGPAGSAIGGIAGAVLGGLAGGVAGGEAGAALGSRLDDTYLDNLECLDCGHSFRLDSE
jgi:outer membrane lipoprotein SlyB